LSPDFKKPIAYATQTHYSLKPIMSITPKQEKRNRAHFLEDRPRRLKNARP
jgi:hypothetical protein